MPEPTPLLSQATQDNQPNADTLAAMAEVQSMLESGSGQHFAGSTVDFLGNLLDS